MENDKVQSEKTQTDKHYHTPGDKANSGDWKNEAGGVTLSQGWRYECDGSFCERHRAAENAKTSEPPDSKK